MKPAGTNAWNVVHTSYAVSQHATGWQVCRIVVDVAMEKMAVKRVAILPTEQAAETMARDLAGGEAECGGMPRRPGAGVLRFVRG